MALPPHLLGNFSASELEFIAEEELIYIVPNVKIPALYLIGGTYGPFRPGRQYEIPIWLAILLKQKQRVEITLPDWLSIGKNSKLEDEKNLDNFSSLPFRFIEISQLILPWVELDVNELDEIRSKLKNIREIRQNKVREGIQAVDQNYLQVDNISHLELNLIRPMLSKSYQHINRMQSQMDQEGDNSNIYD
ncbi:Psf2-domain-containing protein [Conidiobolus coronatus NRRL 28638]|uniref:DNA replication complex GINS protein PSF2 n=1 Tax=Conidiobolus coronatus (strain ATCC 28846 / CBS 209.66 / NRRL 28638) TaxID=796925 RepID=A0A137P642_CONC2|nr:Psf2-domain-containing protein [Conidiobolus coronatus NRRL 28638]|eukprot:KXN70473.1 Psf2-domain-containing protein [Conidiobolus coronatus NRRL 28638]